MNADGTDVVDSVDGVVLRHYRASDVEDIATACNDPLIHRFVPSMPSPYTRHDALAWISESTPPGMAGNFSFAFAEPDGGRLLGGGGFRRFAELTAEVGYWVAPWGRQRGVATAAAKMLTAQAFGQGIQRVTLRTEWENVSSQRVALAAGYTREGVQRAGGASRDGTRHDLIVWTRLHTDAAGPTHRVLPDLPNHAPVGRGELTDGVITLRPLGPDDVDDSFALRSLPEVVASSVPPAAPDRARIERSCTRAEALWLAGERADFTIRDCASTAYAGEISLYYWEQGTQQAMIGYSMLRAWRGRGYATRAARLVADWAFGAVGIVRVVAGTSPDNLGSQRVLEQAGFVREGFQRARLPGLNGTRVDDILYARLR